MSIERRGDMREEGRGESKRGCVRNGGSEQTSEKVRDGGERMI